MTELSVLGNTSLMGNWFGAPRSVEHTPEERQANKMQMAAAVQGAIHELRVAVATWPILEGPLYAGQAALVQAIDLILTALSADVSYSLTVDDMGKEYATPIGDIWWIAERFDAYRSQMFRHLFPFPETSQRAYDSIAEAVQTANIRIALYRCYLKRDSSGIAVRQAHGRLRWHGARDGTISLALIATLTGLREGLGPRARAGVDALIANLRLGMVDHTLIDMFANDMMTVRFDTTVAECIVHLVQAVPALRSERYNRGNPPA